MIATGRGRSLFHLDVIRALTLMHEPNFNCCETNSRLKNVGVSSGALLCKHSFDNEIGKVQRRNFP